MKLLRPFLAVLLVCGMASASLAGSLVLEGAQKSGSGEITIQGGSMVVTVCTVPATPGVTIHAASLDPGCISVAPPSAVTGANGCANFTVACVDGSCSGRILWTATGFADMAGVFVCGPPGVDISKTPTMQTWGLIALAAFMLGISGFAYYRRRRA